MLVGIIFLVVGILIAVYPQLLSMLVAALLILIGVTLTSISYHYKKMKQNFDNPVMDFFIKF
jgi:Flp pilus assembly protein TadB